MGGRDAEWSQSGRVGQALGGWSCPSQSSGPRPWCLASGVSLPAEPGGGESPCLEEFSVWGTKPNTQSRQTRRVGKVWDQGLEGILTH